MMISENLKQELISLIEEKVKELKSSKAPVKVDKKKVNPPHQDPATNYGVPGVC